MSGPFFDPYWEPRPRTQFRPFRWEGIFIKETEEELILEIEPKQHDLTTLQILKDWGLINSIEPSQKTVELQQKQLPDLQYMIKFFGGYDKIPTDLWPSFDAACGRKPPQPKATGKANRKITRGMLSARAWNLTKRLQRKAAMRSLMKVEPVPLLSMPEFLEQLRERDAEHSTE